MSSSEPEHAFAARLGSLDPMLEHLEDDYYIDQHLLEHQEYLEDDDDDDASIEDHLLDYIAGGGFPQDDYWQDSDAHAEVESDEYDEDPVDDDSDIERYPPGHPPPQDSDVELPPLPAYYHGGPQAAFASVSIAESTSDSDSAASFWNPVNNIYGARPSSEDDSSLGSTASIASELSSASLPGSDASASTDSSEDQEGPPRHNRRHVSSAFGIHARALPRRPSLTPDLHPNRRLPHNNPPSFAHPRRRQQLYHQPRPPYHRAHPVTDDSDDDQSTSDPSSDQDTLDQSDEHTEDEEDEEDEQEQQLRDFRRRQISAFFGRHRERGGERPVGQRRAGAGQREEGMDLDDELVEVVYHQPAPPPNQQQRNPRQQPHQNARQNNQGPAHARALADFIDLTEEPDSPVLRRNRPISLPRHDQQNHVDLNDHRNNNYAARHQLRNPRRPMSQSNGRAPALARSDGSILGNAAAAVIDLTSDGPDDEREGIPANRFLPLPVPQQQRNERRVVESFGRGLMGNLPGFGGFGNFGGNLREMFMPRLSIFGNLGHAQNEFDVIGGANPANPNPLAGNPPDFNYQANGFGGFGGVRPATPKPDFEAPPPVRPGFSRDTGNHRDTDEEQVFVCPSCDDELKYAPDDDDGPRPAKRARTKKDREEHHFWAVKACGHVR